MLSIFEGLRQLKKIRGMKLKPVISYLHWFWQAQQLPQGDLLTLFLSIRNKTFWPLLSALVSEVNKFYFVPAGKKVSHLRRHVPSPLLRVRLPINTPPSSKNDLPLPTPILRNRFIDRITEIFEQEH